MKVLWLCNTLLPEAAQKLNIKVSKPESWITGLYNSLKENNDIELIYLFPLKAKKSICLHNTQFLSYFQNNQMNFETKQIDDFCCILKDTDPDIIHIFGSEFPHTYAMVKAAEMVGKLNKTVIHIQGLCSVIAKHYLSGINSKTTHSFTFRDFLRNDNIYRQMLSFKKRGEYEVKALEKVSNVIGRTDFDKACTTRLNPDVKYHFCNETLRDSFYKNEWDISKCEKHSVFVTQSSYTIKGFHYMLEAMADVVKTYPDAVLYTTGKNPLNLSLKQKLRQGSYNKHIGKLIKKYHLENNVRFLGFLAEETICQRYLDANVFVSPSVIENESNSLSEAKIMGVPSIASFVGGQINRVDSKSDGLLYPYDEPYMLAYYIKQIFGDKELALKLSENAKTNSKKLHNREINFNIILGIYDKIAKV